MLKGLKNLFFEDEEEIKSSAKTPVELANQSNLTKHSFVKNVEYPSTVEETVYDKEMMDGLSAILSENNQPGIDYYEFMQSVNNMKGIPTAEQKFQLSFSALQPGGLTKDKILTSAKFYLDKLMQTKQEFENVLNEKISLEVDNVNVQANAVQDEIAKLNKELIELSEKQKLYKETADSNSVKINKNRASFEACYNKFVKEINGDLETINRVLV